MVYNIIRPLRMAILVLLFIVALGTSSVSYGQSTILPDQAEAFVRAAVAINQVNEVWQPLIDRAKSEVDAERLRDKANVAMRQAIRDIGGMTSENYRTIYHTARRDPELAAYLTELFEQEVAGARR